MPLIVTGTVAIGFAPLCEDARISSDYLGGVLAEIILHRLQHCVGFGAELDLVPIDRAPMLAQVAHSNAGHEHMERRRILRKKLILRAVRAGSVITKIV